MHSEWHQNHLTAELLYGDDDSDLSPAATVLPMTNGRAAAPVAQTIDCGLRGGRGRGLPPADHNEIISHTVTRDRRRLCCPSAPSPLQSIVTTEPNSNLGHSA